MGRKSKKSAFLVLKMSVLLFRSLQNGGLVVRFWVLLGAFWPFWSGGRWGVWGFSVLLSASVWGFSVLRPASVWIGGGLPWGGGLHQIGGQYLGQYLGGRWWCFWWRSRPVFRWWFFGRQIFPPLLSWLLPPVGLNHFRRPKSAFFGQFFGLGFQHWRRWPVEISAGGAVVVSFIMSASGGGLHGVGQNLGQWWRPSLVAGGDPKTAAASALQALRRPAGGKAGGIYAAVWGAASSTPHPERGAGSFFQIEKKKIKKKCRKKINPIKSCMIRSF